MAGTTVTCPQGHESTTTDYCDTCGAAIAEAAAEPAADPSAADPQRKPVVVGNCPECGTARVEGESFCEVCGLDYATGKLPTPPAGAPRPADPSRAVPTPTGWTATLEADAEWHAAQDFEGADVPFPDAYRPRTVELSGDVVTIGRRSDADGWYPDIDLSQGDDDRAASRRHAELRRAGDGAWMVVDLGSTNGTSLNGVPVAANEPQPLADGDRIQLGAFTRLVVHAPQGD